MRQAPTTPPIVLNAAGAGEAEGASVVGASVGASVVGASVGASVVGISVVGASVVGASVVGASVGASVVDASVVGAAVVDEHSEHAEHLGLAHAKAAPLRSMSLVHRQLDCMAWATLTSRSIAGFEVGSAPTARVQTKSSKSFILSAHTREVPASIEP